MREVAPKLTELESPMKRAYLFAAALMLAAPAAAGATGVPASNVLKFDVLRDGSPIGTHVVSFSDGGNSVDIKTDIAVKLAFITLYHFKHHSHETWKDGRLVALNSKTNDDGTKHTLSVKADGAKLSVVGDGVPSRVKADIVPASLWREDTVKQTELLNTLKGNEMKVSVTDDGEDSIKVGGKTVTAHHYVMKGDLARELWYGKNGVLEQVRFAAKDGSKIVYQLE